MSVQGFHSYLSSTYKGMTMDGVMLLNNILIVDTQSVYFKEMKWLWENHKDEEGVKGNHRSWASAVLRLIRKDFHQTDPARIVFVMDGWRTIEKMKTFEERRKRGEAYQYSDKHHMAMILERDTLVFQLRFASGEANFKVRELFLQYQADGLKAVIYSADSDYAAMGLTFMKKMSGSKKNLEIERLSV